MKPDTVTDQPAPTPNNRPAVWDLVIADMQARDRTGRERYGTPLQPHNGRDALVDAYQEALDLAVYLRQAIEERGRDVTHIKVSSSYAMDFVKSLNQNELSQRIDELDNEREALCVLLRAVRRSTPKARNRQPEL